MQKNTLVAKQHLYDSHKEEYKVNRNNLEDLFTDLSNELFGKANLDKSPNDSESLEKFNRQ